MPHPSPRSLVSLLALTALFVALGATLAAGSCEEPAATTLTTSLSGEGKSGEEITVNEGAKVKDQATLSGKNASTATGTIKYFVYSDSKCEKLVTKAGETAFTEGKVPASEEKTLEAGAVYYWRAEYGGDSKNAPSKSTCGKEVLTVKAAVSISTALIGEDVLSGGVKGKEITVAEGAAVADTATLSGTNSAKATGTVEYFVYADSECKELLDEAGEVEVEAGSAPASEELELEEGTYRWRAVYGGDALHQAATSPCDEILTVLAPTSLTTSLSGEGQNGDLIEVSEDAVVTDSATLSGPNASEATGTVEYFVYADSECKELVEYAGEVEVEGPTAPASEPVEIEEPGLYYWEAVYSGDANNYRSTSPCTAELQLVLPRVTTVLSGDGKTGAGIKVTAGTPVTDQATLHGKNAFKATGTVEYFVYADDECEELVEYAGEVEVAGPTAPSSEPVEIEEPGKYYWQAEYSGDGNNPAASSSCGGELLYVVTPVSVSTTLTGGEEEGAEIEVEEGTAISDQATLSGANAGTAEGVVFYSVYADSKCTELAASAGEGQVSEGTAEPSEEVTLPHGTYYWQAEYMGDDANEAATSTCGGEIAVVTTPITTTLSGENDMEEEVSGEKILVLAETPVTDEATLHGEGASEAKGTVEYLVYADEECKELVESAGVVEVEGATVPASEPVEFEKPGIYYWQAEYLDEESNLVATSTCGIEAVQVVEKWKYAALGDSYSSGEGVRQSPNTTYYAKETDNNYKYGPGPNECHRSESAWPALVAEKALGNQKFIETAEVFKEAPERFIFRACSGARVKNIWNKTLLYASGQYREFSVGTGWSATQPAQARWLLIGGFPGKDVSVVTLTIGGNDSGFVPVVEACIEFRPFGLLGYDPNPCVEEIAKKEIEGFKTIEEELPDALKKIRELEPDAKILVFQYPYVLNLAKDYIDVGIGHVINNVEPTKKGGATAAQHMHGLVVRLNALIKAEVKKSGVKNVEVRSDAVGALRGHQLGDKKPWINDIRFWRKAESFHPDACGHRAIASEVVQAVKPGAPPILPCP